MFLGEHSMLTAPSTSLVNWFSMVLEGKYDSTHVWWENTHIVCIRTHGPKPTFQRFHLKFGELSSREMLNLFCNGALLLDQKEPSLAVRTEP
jgi:hypothetical protein